MTFYVISNIPFVFYILEMELLLMLQVYFVCTVCNKPHYVWPWTFKPQKRRADKIDTLEHRLCSCQMVKTSAMFIQSFLTIFTSSLFLCCMHRVYSKFCSSVNRSSLMRLRLDLTKWKRHMGKVSRKRGTIYPTNMFSEANNGWNWCEKFLQILTVFCRTFRLQFDSLEFLYVWDIYWWHSFPKFGSFECKSISSRTNWSLNTRMEERNLHTVKIKDKKKDSQSEFPDSGYVREVLT